MAIPGTINNHAGLIWAIADLLRGDYKRSEYGRAILPLVDRPGATGGIAT